MDFPKRNVNVSNEDRKFKARKAILEALSDLQWHRNMELKAQTKLSSRTLNKHLDEMKEAQVIKRKPDVINGKHAVLFKARPETITYYKSYVLRNKFFTHAEKVLNETKDPLMILDAIHITSQIFFIELLGRIQQNKKITQKEIDFFGDCCLWTNYKQWISELIEASSKIIDNIDITQSLVKQAKRQIESHKKVLKNYEEILQQTDTNAKTKNNS